MGEDQDRTSRRELEDYITRYGHRRLCFGSDYPFGHPAQELAKVLSLNLPQDQQQAVLADNFRHVCSLEE